MAGDNSGGKHKSKEICVYIYIYREREREREICIYIYIYICIYIYIYIKLGTAASHTTSVRLRSFLKSRSFNEIIPSFRVRTAGTRAKECMEKNELFDI